MKETYKAISNMLFGFAIVFAFDVLDLISNANYYVDYSQEMYFIGAGLLGLSVVTILFFGIGYIAMGFGIHVQLLTILHGFNSFYFRYLIFFLEIYCSCF